MIVIVRLNVDERRLRILGKQYAGGKRATRGLVRNYAVHLFYDAVDDLAVELKGEERCGGDEGGL